MSKREMFSKARVKSYGVMGELAGVTRGAIAQQNLFVGDLVSYIALDGEQMHSGIVVKSNDNNFYVMGYWGFTLDRFPKIVKVLSHEYVTNEIVEHLHSMEIIEPKRMTVQEVENKLGYPIIIVEGDNEWLYLESLRQ